MGEMDTFTCRRSRWNHPVIALLGLPTIGVEEPTRLRKKNFIVSREAEECFLDARYDDRLLIPNLFYDFALIPGREIEEFDARTIEGLLALGKRYEYGDPFASSIPRIREKITDASLDKLGFEYIAALDPIGGRVLMMTQRNSTYLYSACGVTALDAHRRWCHLGAFAFPII